MLVSQQTRIQIAILIFVAACSLGTYLSLSNGQPGAFLLDDRTKIVDAGISGFHAPEFARAILNSNFVGLGRSLSLLSLYTTKAIYGNQSAPFLYQDILLHVCTGMVLFWLLGKLLDCPGFRGSIPRGHHWTVAAVVTAVWMLHPLQVSTALYLVQRMVQLSTLFSLSALLCYTAGRAAQTEESRTGAWQFMLAILFSIAAVAAKENAVLIPLFVLLIELFAFRFRPPIRRAARHIYFLFLICIIVAPLALGGLYILYNHDSLLAGYSVREFTLSERIASESYIVWEYVAMILLPNTGAMSLYHDGHAILSWNDPRAIFSITGWILVLATTVVLGRRAPLFSFGILLFLTGHFLESTFLPLELMFEHRNYLPMIGLLLAVPGLLALTPISNYNVSNYNIGGIFATCIFALCLILGISQASRASLWGNEEALVLHAISSNPKSDRAAATLTNYLLRAGRIQDARSTLKRALQNGDRSDRLGLMTQLTITHCYEDHIPQPLLDGLKRRLNNDRITAYAASGLLALYERFNLGQCSAMDAQNLLEISWIASNNPRAGAPVRFNLKIQTGSILMRGGLPGKARKSYMSALETHEDIPHYMETKLHVLIGKTCLEQGMIPCARRHAHAAETAMSKALLPEAARPERALLDDLHTEIRMRVSGTSTYIETQDSS